MTLNLLVSPLLSFAVLKVGNSLIEQFCLMHGMKDNREKLQRQLLAIQAVIANAEERGASEPHVRAWLKDLITAAYKAADVLDEFQYEALRRLALSPETSSGIKKVTKSITLHNNPLLFRYKMSKKLKSVLEKINEIISEMKNFSFIAHEHQPVITRPPTHSCIIESEIIGRDDAKEDVMNMLLDPNLEMVNISVLPIVGMGGAGKTTLAKLVYNEEKVQEYFKLRMWVCASNDFGAVSILRSLIEVATNGQCLLSTSNLEVLQTRLREILVGKKYLLVLDDVWNEETHKWDALKPLLFSGACLGSVIIVTTRSKRVASIMGTLPYHDLKMLSEEDSWNLFRKRTFGGDEEPQQLVEIGRKIVNKCAGLPLALMAIGGLMRTTRDVREWRSISENKIWDGVASTNEVLPALMLSYDQLPFYMKQCFAFCATFPQDYEFEKERLIQLWMANDFIPNDDIIDLEDKGEYIFNELCWRSFFQDIRVWGSFYTKIITNCKMHDLMHDLAKHIAGEQCVTTLELESDKVFHLSVVNHPSSHSLNSILKKCPIIRTCLVSKGFANKSEKVKQSMKTISLRALEMQHIKEIPTEFGYMKHLRYLDLSYGKFDSVPETVTMLYNLLTLNLSGSKISKLPEGMRYMISLRHLFINGCKNLKRMPTGLGQLSSLRILTNYILDSDPGHNIGQLNNLDLHEFLYLSGLENVRDKNEACTANMVSKINLFSLYLTWGSLDDRDATTIDQEVLDGLRPSNETKDLYIDGYAGFDFPIWMKETHAIRNLSALYFVNCHKCTTLPPIWDLPVLKCLHLRCMKSLVYVYSQCSIEGEESDRLIIFPNLKSLVISSLDNLERWHEKDDKLVAFPQLDELYITSCPKIRTIPFAPLLRCLCIEKSIEIKLLEISNLSLIASSIVTIVCESPTETDAFKPPKNVVTMCVEGFGNVIPLQETDMESNQNMTVRDITITRSNCFFSSGPCKESVGFWKYFVSLEILYIDDCNALCFWPEQEFRCLRCLKQLHIEACDNFTCSSQVPSSSTETLGASSQVSSSSIESCGEDILPRLETLIIEECPKLVVIPSCCKSLKTFTLQNCPSISKEGLNYLRNLNELKELTIDDCPGLNSLPDGLESLTSLQRLILYNCPGIEEFPQGLHQRLPALQTLKIKASSVLLGLCRSGGQYHRLISAIPDLTIGPI